MEGLHSAFRIQQAFSKRGGGKLRGWGVGGQREGHESKVVHDINGTDACALKTVGI